MKYTPIVLILLFCACSNKTTNHADNANYLDQYSTSIESVISKDLLVKLPLINDSVFIIDSESSKYRTKDLVALSDTQMSYFFSTDKLIEIRNYLSPKWFFYGRLQLWKGFLPILLINRGSSEIYFICFLINKEGKIFGFFIPGYSESQPNYSMIGSGEIMGDSTYVLTEVSYIEIDSMTKMQDSVLLRSFSKDSSITKIFVDYAKGIIEDRKRFPTDTIK